MKTSFGPWTTAINTGAPHQLDTFWKRRLAMLPSLSQTTSGSSRRTLLFLAAVAIAALALPTLKWATHAHSADPVVVVVDDAELPDQFAAPEVEYLPRPSKFEEEVLAALKKPVDIEFSKLTLAECIDYLQQESKLPMWIDEQNLTDEGIALDKPITLKLKATRLESVLNLLLHPAQLEYLPENEVLIITTMTKASEKMITRTYPVRDLIHVGKWPDKESREDKSAGTRSEVPAKTDGEKEPTTRDVNSPESEPSTGAANQVLKQGFGGGRGGMGGGMVGGAGGGGTGVGGGLRYVPPRDGLGYMDFTSLMNLITTSI